MLILGGYLLLVCAIIQLGLIPMLGSANLFNTVCL